MFGLYILYILIYTVLNVFGGAKVANKKGSKELGASKKLLGASKKLGCIKKVVY